MITPPTIPQVYRYLKQVVEDTSLQESMDNTLTEGFPEFCKFLDRLLPESQDGMIQVTHRLNVCGDDEAGKYDHGEIHYIARIGECYFYYQYDNHVNMNGSIGQRGFCYSKKGFFQYQSVQKDFDNFRFRFPKLSDYTVADDVFDINGQGVCETPDQFFDCLFLDNFRSNSIYSDMYNSFDHSHYRNNSPLLRVKSIDDNIRPRDYDKLSFLREMVKTLAQSVRPASPKLLAYMKKLELPKADLGQIREAQAVLAR